MNIMISINREFIPCACVMLMSLKEHHADTELSVYVLHHELTQQDFLEMDQVIGPDGIALIPVYIPEGTVRDFQMGKWPEEAAYRLLATDLFARDMDRILHLDTDMLITGSLLDFYNTSFDDNYLVAFIFYRIRQFIIGLIVIDVITIYPLKVSHLFLPHRMVLPDPVY